MTMIVRVLRMVPKLAIATTKIVIMARVILVMSVAMMIVVRIAIMATITAPRRAARKVVVLMHVAPMVIVRTRIALKAGVRKALRRACTRAPSLGVMKSAAARRRTTASSAVTVRIVRRLLVTTVAVRPTFAAACRVVRSSIASQVRVVRTFIVRRTVLTFAARTSAVPIGSGCVPSVVGSATIAVLKARRRSTVLKAVGPVGRKDGAQKVPVLRDADPKRAALNNVVPMAVGQKVPVQRDEVLMRVDQNNVVQTNAVPRAVALKALQIRRAMPALALIARALSSAAPKVDALKVVALTPVGQKVAGQNRGVPKRANRMRAVLKVAALMARAPKVAAQPSDVLKVAAPMPVVALKALHRATPHGQRADAPRVVALSVGQRIGPIANQIDRVMSWNRFELRNSCWRFHGSEDFIEG